MTKKLACVTLDMERDHSDPEGRIRLLENPDYFERYVNIIQKHKVKVTMFTVTSLFTEFGAKFKELESRIPLEYEVHSHSHNPRNACGLDEVQMSYDAYIEHRGRKPLGYRSPIGQINKDGLQHLIDFNYPYDSSVYPSYRPGEYGYSNLDKPNVPFLITSDRKKIVEFPFTCISTLRIPFALSYAKLFGWAIYSSFLKMFSLPDTALLLSHPNDLYFYEMAKYAHGIEKMAMSRNSYRAFEYLEKLIVYLKDSGYDFVFMSELYDLTKNRSDLPVYTLADWK
jgi:peptidoglycan/xylan/chitin deacetylase (PgdA/CDA1 family)